MRTALALVTAADAAYFRHLQGLVLSLREAAPSTDFTLCVIDLGLLPVQRAWIEEHADRVAEGRWDFDLPRHYEPPRSLQGLLCRPFLPAYFPGHDVYVWLDADTWVQHFSAVRLFAAAAETGAMGLVPELARAYRNHYDGGRSSAWMRGCYAEAFGDEIADLLRWHPVISAGAFALKADSPAWRVWAEHMEIALPRTLRCVDQTALNVAVYTDAVAAHFLSASSHWVCIHGLPLLDAGTGRLLHPRVPHDELGILHLGSSGAEPRPVPTTEGGTEWRSLAWRGGHY